MNKSLFLIILLSFPADATPLTDKEEFELQQQKEKDEQELKLKILATLSTIALAVIAAYVQVYIKNKQQ